MRNPDTHPPYETGVIYVTNITRAPICNCTVTDVVISTWMGEPQVYYALRLMAAPPPP